MTITTDKILTVLRAKAYKVAEADTKPFNLNLVGIRAHPGKPNAFDDTMLAFWKYQGAWTMRSFPCTTDPGLYWLENPMNKNGTGILKEGQYENLWQIGRHQGKYEALVQRSACTVIRDFDRDKELDYASGKEETGLFGLNCHRAAENGASIEVGKWSAACQVLQNRHINNPDNQLIKVFEYDYFMHLCKQRGQHWGLDFTYTLINQKDIA